MLSTVALFAGTTLRLFLILNSSFQTHPFFFESGIGCAEMYSVCETSSSPLAALLLQSNHSTRATSTGFRALHLDPFPHASQPSSPPLGAFCEQHTPHITASTQLALLPVLPVQSRSAFSSASRDRPAPSASLALQEPNVRADVLSVPLPLPPCFSHCPFVLRLHSYAVRRGQFFLSSFLLSLFQFPLTSDIHALQPTAVSPLFLAPILSFPLDP